MSNGLDVALMKDPHGEWAPENGDRHTDIAFGDHEWGSFFFDALGAKNAEYVEREKYESFVARRKSAFLSSLRDYPLLARIDEFYQDACFAVDEIQELEAELNRVRDLPMDELARNFLNGMLEGCSLAKAEGLGIRLLSS